MKILSIDTSSKICGVALLEDFNLISDNSISNGLTHSETLMPAIGEMLQKNNLSLDEIDLIACCVGPGSFTGIRIGVSSCKALAETKGMKIAEVTSLESLAQNIEDYFDTKVSLIDARNNQVYCGIFDNEINLKEEYFADDINVIIDHLRKYNNICCVGDGAVLHKNLINDSLENVNFCKQNEQTALSCGRVGLKKYKENNLKNADSILPIYLRPSQAERLKKKEK